MSKKHRSGAPDVAAQRGIPRFDPGIFDRLEADLFQTKEEIVILRRALTKRGANPDIIKRRAIVANNPDLPLRGICELFDYYKIPLQKSMAEEETWVQASKVTHHKNVISSLLTRDKSANSI